MAQTATQWLIEEIHKNMGIWIPPHIQDQAKEMEKEQIIKFAEIYEEYCHNSFIKNSYVQVKSAEQYYNETFKTKNP